MSFRCGSDQLASLRRGSSPRLKDHGVAPRSSRGGTFSEPLFYRLKIIHLVTGAGPPRSHAHLRGQWRCT